MNSRSLGIRQVVLFLVLLSALVTQAQTAVVVRNVFLRPTPSTLDDPITKLLPGEKVQLVDSNSIAGFYHVYHVQTANKQSGYVWGRNVRVEQTADSTPSTATIAPTPRLGSGHTVDWWAVFKLNSAAFPGCSGSATRTCIFGGTVQNYRAFSQRYVVASSERRDFQEGANCLGDSVDDPVGATFKEVYDGTFNYVIWNDQFYGDPQIAGCGTSCGAPWGHSKGMVAWNDSGGGFIMQVSTPSWPAAGSKLHPRLTDGNTLGCVTDNDVQVSQHFFALRLTKQDLLKVLAALQNASVVTDTANLQIVHNGGPADVQALVRKLGTRSSSTTATHDVLSTGVQLISKPSKLNVPPWQLVSAHLGGVSLRTATWWANPKIASTSTSISPDCWDPSLPAPGAVEIATTGQWNQTIFGLTGGPGKDFNHAKLGVSTTGAKHYAIFGDLNQQGSLTSPKCGSSQNGRGGLFFVLEDEQVARSLSQLIEGDSAPVD